MSVEEIKKALEGDMNTGLTAIDRLRFIVGGVPDFDPITVEDADWIISALESLQRENEELRKDKDHIAAEKAGIAKNAHSNVDYWKSQAEAAEAEVKRLRGLVLRARELTRPHIFPTWHKDANAALASTGGEHNGN